MKKLSYYDKAQLLKAGQHVFIRDNWFKARQLKNTNSFEACSFCKLDCICYGEVTEVCWELETSHSHGWILELCSKE